jgi:hypothetical protein
MTNYVIVEVDEGLTIALVAENSTPKEAAESSGGQLIDPGPYESYEDAYDAMMALEDEGEELE